METNAIKLENGHYGCPNCRGEEFRTLMHIDGIDFFTWEYECTNCKTHVFTKEKRSKESMYYWTDEDMEE